MKFGIVTFPGSNCDYDAFHAVTEILGEEAVYLWHKDHDLQGSDIIILPGAVSNGGMYASAAPVLSSGLPAKYLGTIHAPERVSITKPDFAWDVGFNWSKNSVV